MTRGGRLSHFSGDALEAQCANVLLGRLGSELALIYHDTLQAPLPPGLQATVDRLHLALGPRGSDLPGERKTSPSNDSMAWTSSGKER